MVHLKNGGTIVADSIEDRGDTLVVRQGKSRIVVPRADVASIEKTPPKTGAAPAAPPAGRTPSGDPPLSGTRGPDVPPAGPAADARLLDDLRRRLQTPGPARGENLRQIVELLDRMGEGALRDHRPDDAKRQFTEALGWNAGDVRGQRGLAASYMALDNLPLARSFLERSLLEHPNDPDLLFLLGETAEQQNRTDEAIALWEKVLALRDAPALRQRVEMLRHLSSVDAGYQRREAAHFTVAYDGQITLPDLEHAIVGYLDERYDELATRFDYLPTRPVAIVIYPEKDFYAATRADPDVAGLYDGTVRVPCGGLSHLDALSRSVLVHELAHAFVAGKSHDAAPRWLQEGLAQMMEGKTPDEGTARALARQYQSSSERAPWGATFTYPSSLSFVSFLSTRYGFGSINQTLAGLGEGRDLDGALRAATGFPLDDLRRQWGDDLVTRLP
ncbi:MAG TPA: tetratricopeptide repeat protein [Patescibacteria group bacterium]|nr:tetratricopeptide repeat protein [Patescibacteria group bacterium]